jgi:hypothetical protein
VSMHLHGERERLPLTYTPGPFPSSSSMGIEGGYGSLDAFRHKGTLYTVILHFNSYTTPRYYSGCTVGFR